MNDKGMIFGVIILLIAAGGVLYGVSGNKTLPVNPVISQTSSSSTTATGPNVPLAQCLKEKGVVFYGAFWCPHCKKQKEEFGAAVPALPYVECSTPDGNGQTPICTAKGIKSYPTWRFPDGSELTGEQSLAILAEKSNCTQALTPSISVKTASTTPL